MEKNSEWNNPGALEQFEMLNKVIHASRSLISDYGIKKGATGILSYILTKYSIC